MSDRIRHVKLSHVVLPLPTPVSDAKVLTGRQKPLTETVLLFVEVSTEQGWTGTGFSYSKRSGGPAQYTHLKEIATSLEAIISRIEADIAITEEPSRHPVIQARKAFDLLNRMEVAVDFPFSTIAVLAGLTLAEREILFSILNRCMQLRETSNEAPAGWFI